MNKKWAFLTVSAIFCVSFLQSISADNILLLVTDDTRFELSHITNTQNALTSLGHTFVNTGTSASGETFSDFDQIWDLRPEFALSVSEQNAYNDYLAQGGRLLLKGEKVTSGFTEFQARDNSIINFVSLSGGGTLVQQSQQDQTFTESFTTEGQQLFNVTNMPSLSVINPGQLSVQSGQGFLVTEKISGQGSMVAWDFGDIAGKNNSRMVVIFESALNSQNGNTPQLIENFVTFLGASSPIPEPSSFVLVALAMLGFFKTRR